MPQHPVELEGLYVVVDRVEYSPHLQAPPERPHPFVYYISIHNESDRAVTVKARKWVVTDVRGGKIVVEGDGVVGKMPRLEPGESFTYNSYHTVRFDSYAEGSYLALDDEGAAILTRIPRFDLLVPR